MVAEPAAAMANSRRLGALHRRLYELVMGLSSASRELLAASLLPAGVATPEPARRCRNDFYWLLFPEWLADDDDGALDDLLWAQYCVYGLLRVQDDAVDDQRARPHLIVAANHLALAATRALRPHFDGASPLWDWFDRAISQTSDALVTLDRLQATHQRPGSEDLPWFARLSRCLTIALQGTLLRRRGEADRRRWLEIFDQVAIASQILDDFHDMTEDLAQGRLNYAAWHLSQPVFSSSREATEAVIASNIATSDRLRSLLDRVRRHLALAATRLEAGDGRRPADYLARYRRTVDRLEETVRGRRAHLLVPPVLESCPSDASYTPP